MSTTTFSPELQSAPSIQSRLISVFRLHLVNRSQIIVMPWLILSFIFVVSLSIGWLVQFARGQAGFEGSDVSIQSNGVLVYFLIYLLVLAVMAINQTFPFAQSYSVTRRDFYLGTVLTFFVLSIGYAIVITALGWLEDQTHGWGVDVALFNPGFTNPNLAERLYVTIVLFMLGFMVGIATASVYVRWKANGMYVFFGSLLLLCVALVWLTAATNSWGTVWSWATTTGLLGVVTWTLLPSALAILTGYLILRKAVPRN